MRANPGGEIDRSGSPTGAPGSAVAWDGSASLSRAALVERARAGDPRAFERLLDRWLEPAFHTALAILGSEADARDATQDAFLRAWRDLRQLRDPERFDAWLGRILVNSCRGIRRTRRRVTVREVDLGAIPARDEPSASFEAAWGQDSGSLDAVEHAFETLAIPERTLLVLHHLEHRPLVEIAAALDIPVGTAKSRLFKARRALEQALEAESR